MLRIFISSVLFIVGTTSCKAQPGNLRIKTNPNTESRTDSIGKYPIVDTGQDRYFENISEIESPTKGEPFYGQDAMHSGKQRSYTKVKEGIVLDNVTGLMWQSAYAVMTYSEALQTLQDFNLGGYDDWRLPTIKESYSLMCFDGIDPSGMRRGVPDNLLPFIDTAYFDFSYGANGDRPIDSQMLSSTIYRGKTMMVNQTVFGVNFADGRIKGYPLIDPRGEKKFMVRFVRGNTEYGKNNFTDNKDGTITDDATGLMWSKEDSGKGMNWEDALAWVEQMNAEKYLGYDDWRLPNAKELHSIVDYNHAPQLDHQPAIDPVFHMSEISVEDGQKNFPFYWTSTTHINDQGGSYAVYFAFGDAFGYFAPPHSGRPKELMDVHGAGAQRSDPKSGSAQRFPQGHGPQGDVIRILNYVRLVRG